MNMAEFFEVEQVTLPTERTIEYSLGHNTGTTQYITIKWRRDELLLREISRAFLDHARINKDNNADQRYIYDEVYNKPNKDLPKPDFKRTGIKYNTYASFVNGIEDNFADTTRHYTIKQWPHVIDIANIAVEYFNNVHPSYFGKPLLPFKAVRK